MKKLFLLAALLLVFWNSFSQSTNISTFFHKNVKKADHFFDHYAYRNALEIYRHSFERDSADYHVRERIAMCYFKLHDPVSAELWYSGLANEPDIHPAAKFEYAEALSMNGKYEESMHWFQEYLKDNPKDQIALDKLEFLKNITDYLVHDERFIVTSFGLNTDHAEYGAHYFHDGIVFASSKDTDLFIKHKPFDGLSVDESLLNLYFGQMNVAGVWDKNVPFHNAKLKTYYHEGPMAFYDNFKRGAFTQSNIQNGKPVYDSDGKVNLRIYFAEVAHLGDFEHVAPFEHNNDEYSNAHPSFSPDGSVMYFSSTMPTGYGDSDIYYSLRTQKGWSQPVNLGSAINTREDESFPYLANDTTLYFSSNGHGTLGGLDIYVTYKRNGEFGKPINLGTPMNTRFDDFSLVCDSLGRHGYIASNREGGVGQDDIYSYRAHFYLLAGKVRELSSGQDNIPNAKIVAYNSNGDVIDSTRSDANGYFSLNLPFDQDFKIRGEKQGFETLDDLAFTTRGKPFGVDSLTLPLWRQSLAAKGKVYSNETQLILPGAMVVLENQTDGIKDSVVVADGGNYQFALRPGKKYRIDGSKGGFITNGFNLDTKGIFEGDLVNDILLEEIYMDKDVILFDYDDVKISADSEKQLNQILKMLVRYPKAIVNVGAHADSRGTKEYNTMLSRKRALATQRYLVANGIPASRIQLTWFGEELILNNCSDGVECPEEEHSKNRRAELKVQKNTIK
jgi:outer membrane protein OmpA-like peptidoglycan-associated protein